MKNILILLTSILILKSVNLFAQWEPDVRLTNDPAFSSTAFNNAWSVAASGNIVHVVWRDNRDGNNEIYYKRSSDSGLTWGADKRLTNLVERTTRLVILARMTGTDARSAREGFTKKLRHVPALLRQTLTYDRGKEMAEHERLAERLASRIFFPDPYSPWQRGTNENTNGLLRQYLPKGTDLSGYTQRELNAIAHRLNTRPRKCLDFATPLEVYAHLRHHSPVALGT